MSLRSMTTGKSLRSLPEEVSLPLHTRGSPVAWYYSLLTQYPEYMKDSARRRPFFAPCHIYVYDDRLGLILAA